MHPNKRAQYLAAMQITEWSLRKNIEPVIVSQEEKVVATVSSEQNLPDKSAKQEVFQLQGTGNDNADCILLGDIAVVDEAEFAFADSEIALLNNMLQAIDLTQDEIFTVKPLACIASFVRDPQETELKLCKDYLYSHIEAIQPKVILVMNQMIAGLLLDTQQTLAQLSGKVYTLPSSSINIIVTYPPGHLLNKPLDKSKAWQDLKQLKNILNKGK